MQLRDGTVSVTNGQNKATFDIDADLTDAKTALDAGLPVLFSLDIEPKSTHVYDVGTITPPSTSASGFWELTVDGFISDANQAGVAYCVHKDFTVNNNWPLFSPGDVQVAQILSRFIAALDASIVGAIPLKTGRVELSNGQTFYDVTGIPAQSLVGGKYIFRVHFNFENVVDGTNASPLNGIVTAKTSTTCRIEWTPSTDSANYVLYFVIFKS